MVDFEGYQQELRMKKILPEQCRAARAMLDWTQERLAASAGLSRSTIRDFECCKHELHQATEQVLVSTLEKAGVRLLFNQNEPGVLLHRIQPAPSAAARGKDQRCNAGYSSRRTSA